jgi:TRAP-type C4-dicarboxylate transport system permease small subunit
MVGLIQLIIYLFCAYLIYKGFEIFQIALVSNPTYRSRNVGIIIGAVAIAVAVVISFVAIILMDEVTSKISNSFQNIR